MHGGTIDTVVVQEYRDSRRKDGGNVGGTRSDPGMTTSVSLFQGFELRSGGVRRELPANAQRLVAFLALDRRPRSRATVAGVLWRDSSEERAASSLRTALWRARAMAADVIVAGRNDLQLGPEVTVDVGEMIGTARQVSLGVGALGPGEVVDRLVGDLLPDWGDDWLVIERERVRQIQLHCLEQLCVELAEAGETARAIEAGLAAVAAEPLRESAHRALIKAHLAEGNMVEAVRQYDALRSVLNECLGIEPGEQARALVSPHR